MSFDIQHRIFEGHFPGHPIVPGVCTLAIVKEALESALGKNLMLHESSVIKFLGLIHPDSRPILDLNWDEQEKYIQVTARLQEGGNMLFKLVGKYIPMQASGQPELRASLQKNKE
ncbi:MAG: 3-hydroxyacyl-ACP dehydratase [Bacteroidetes bacterium]|nr:3-hydroxyacyl-ACP dehydratase [Bacteroidota bacterium]